MQPQGSSGERDQGSDDASGVHAALLENYARTQYHYVEFLTTHLADCSRAFGGDLQEMLVLAVIGQVHLRAHLDAARDGSVSRRAGPADRSISASRLADVTGIPRQTVRRKLQRLQASGWIEQSPQGRWQLVIDASGVSKARGAFADLDARSMERVARLLVALKRII